MVLREQLIALDALLDRERDLAAAKDVAGFERGFPEHRQSVQLGAVSAPDVGQQTETALELQTSVLARDSRRDDDDVAAGRAADESFPVRQDHAAGNPDNVSEVDREQLSPFRLRERLSVRCGIPARR